MQSASDKVKVLSPAGDVILSAGSNHQVSIESGSNFISMGGDEPMLFSNGSNISFQSRDESIILDAADELNLISQSALSLHTGSSLHLNGTTATVIRWDSKLDRNAGA